MDVIATDEFAQWVGGLADEDFKATARAIGWLENRGVTLGYPQSSAIAGASFALRELRVQSMGRPLRIFYAFDPQRDAVLILGGDKTGNPRFYEEMVPQCETLWTRYLAEQAAGLHGATGDDNGN